MTSYLRQTQVARKGDVTNGYLAGGVCEPPRILFIARNYGSIVSYVDVDCPRRQNFIVLKNLKR